jgi:hypothetical protein
MAHARILGYQKAQARVFRKKKPPAIHPRIDGRLEIVEGSLLSYQTR